MPAPTPSLRRTFAVFAAAATLAGAVGLVTSSPAEGAFPGANGLIAFTEYDTVDDDLAVGVMQPDGSGATILADSSVDENSARWSPDGSKLVFAVGSGATSEIWVMNADGSGQSQITENDQQDFQPTWSADGSQIAFMRQMPSTQYDIWVMDADGTGEYQLTDVSDDGVSAFTPAWSPDGSRIAYTTRTDDEDDWDVYTVAPDGSDVQQLTPDDDLDASSPDWSPDGSRIVYALGGEDPTDLWVMDADGSGQEPLYGTNDSEGSPVWSPDGTKIAFDQFDGSGSRIGIIDADGSNPVLVTPANVDRSNPNWQPIAVEPTTTTTPASSVVPTAPHTSVAPLTPVARAVAQSPRFTG